MAKGHWAMSLAFCAGWSDLHAEVDSAGTIHGRAKEARAQQIAKEEQEARDRQAAREHAKGQEGWKGLHDEVHRGRERVAWMVRVLGCLTCLLL